MKDYLLFLFLMAGIIPADFVIAASPADIVINEIAWMGTMDSANDEWIELYNTTDAPIDLNGWTSSALDGSPVISLTGSIPSRGFYLLERTDDNTLPGIPANQIYTGALNNGGGSLKLYDNATNIIDSADFTSGWPAGDNATKQTMERVDLVTWQTSQAPGGTPKSPNSLPMVGSLPSEQGPVAVYPSGIIINELLPSPEGVDAEEEWIEIFNQNNFEVDLALWQITDTIGKAAIYAFPANTIILGQGYLVLKSKTTKISLNNLGDGLTLSQPDGKIVDVVNYEKAPRGQSFTKNRSGWSWSQTPTPGAMNVIPVQEKPKEEAKTLQNNNLAAIAESMPQNTRSYPLPFFIAFLTALFSAVAIFLLKKKTKIC